MKNKIVTGLLTGLFAPPAAFYIFCLIQFPGISVFDLIEGYQKRNVLTHVISLSVIINLAIFFIFLKGNLELSARGVLGATLLYAFVVMILKFA